MRVLVAPLAALLVGLVALAAGCFDPTQITVKITTNAACSDVTAGETAIYTSSSPLSFKPDGTLNGTAATVTNACTPTSSLATIGSLVLVPSGDRNADLSLQVVTSLGKPVQDCTATHFDGCIAVRRRVGFRAHDNVTLPLQMRAECIGIVCPDNQTCVLGTCRDANTGDSSFCDEDSCDGGSISGNDGGSVDSGDGHDAGAIDASVLPLCPGTEKGPVRLATGIQTAAYNMVDTATDLYWAASAEGTVWSFPKAGIANVTAPQQWAGPEDTPAFVAHDATKLYWTAVPGLRAETLPNTGVTIGPQSQEIGGGAAVSDPAGNGVYWWSSDTNQVVFTTKPLTGAALSRTLTTGTGQTASAMAFDGSYIYWTNRGTAPGIMKVAIAAAGAMPTAFEPGVSGVGLAVDETSVYWTASDGSVKALRKDKATGPITLASGLSGLYGIAIHGNFVYVTESGISPNFAGSVIRIPKTGGPLIKIVSGRSPFAITADAQCVYWLLRDAGEIWKASL